MIFTFIFNIAMQLFFLTEDNTTKEIRKYRLPVFAFSNYNVLTDMHGTERLIQKYNIK